MNMKDVQMGRQRVGAHGHAAEGGAVAAGGEVALHYGLVGGVLLQVEEEAVDGHGPEGGLGAG